MSHPVLEGDCAVQGEVRSRVAHRLRWEAVEEVGGGVQGFCPHGGGRRGQDRRSELCSSTGPRVAREEARAEASRPHVERSTARGDTPGVER
jgi:hypothetical protein